ncbi:MAG: DUF5715 family protein [Bacteroidales bacterium]|nr:DUF5715 family protein [Bacteroidales bacterium]
MKILAGWGCLACLLLAGCGGASEEYHYQGDSIRYSRTFNDMNARHLEAAGQFGLPAPPETRDDISLRGLVQIKTCREYSVEELTSSVPYLTKGAAAELKSIGVLFQTKLKENGLPLYRPIVTSVLRTKEDVLNLRKVNVNASANSAHCYGTTFDLACVRYDKVGRKKGIVPDAELKTALAEILREEKAAGNIYVKYEVKQNCFHITCRKQAL